MDSLFSALLGSSRPFSALLGSSRPFSALLGPSRPFSALLGPDPIESPTSGRPGVFEPLSVTIAAALTVETFFPQLITDPSHGGLVVAFITVGAFITVVALS